MFRGKLILFRDESLRNDSQPEISSGQQIDLNLTYYFRRFNLKTSTEQSPA